MANVVVVGPPGHGGELVGLDWRRGVWRLRWEVIKSGHATVDDQGEGEFQTVLNTLSVKMREPKPLG